MYRSDPSQFYHREEAQKRVYRTDSSQIFHHEKAQKCVCPSQFFRGKAQTRSALQPPELSEQAVRKQTRARYAGLIPDLPTLPGGR